MTLIMYISAHAHEGHEHTPAPGTEASVDIINTVILSDTAINNLGIQTVKAQIVPHASSIDMNGIVEFLPERQAIVHAHALGRVSEIYAKVGEKINKNQTLLTFQPIFIGSSPVSITAPISGYITKQNVVIGQSITPETPLMEMGDSSEVLVRGVMYETPEVSTIQIGQRVRVTSDLVGTQTLTGTVQRMDSTFDRNSRTFNVYAIVQNPDLKLIANMQVVLSIEISHSANRLTVPAKAILGESGNNFVFVKNGNEFERRSVKLGEKFGVDREILEGIFPDEQVVTVGNYQLQFATSSIDQHEGKD
ncbi:MAG: efflux RND transporter periplasmic adaptor subunit [Legionellales bacterium]